jgi:AcrB/AcrD/AcrF family
MGDSVRAAIEAGFTVLMTSLAMIIGMVPMALDLGEGGEQNAPLGRAVIGGLLSATVAMLIFVPTVFSRYIADVTTAWLQDPATQPTWHKESADVMFHEQRVSGRWQTVSVRRGPGDVRRLR